MNTFNKDIILWLGNGKEKLQFYAFQGNPERQTQSLLKRIMWPNKFKYPIARLYHKGILVKTWLQGMEIKDINEEKPFFGSDISSFKIKIILKDLSKVGPFYSNAFLEEKPQFNMLIEQYLKYKYERKFISALIIDIRNGKDEIFATAKPTKSGFFNIIFANQNK